MALAARPANAAHRLEALLTAAEMAIGAAGMIPRAPRALRRRRRADRQRCRAEHHRDHCRARRSLRGHPRLSAAAWISPAFFFPTSHRRTCGPCPLVARRRDTGHRRHGFLRAGSRHGRPHQAQARRSGRCRSHRACSTARQRQPAEPGRPSPAETAQRRMFRRRSLPACSSCRIDGSARAGRPVAGCWSASAASRICRRNSSPARPGWLRCREEGRPSRAPADRPARSSRRA
jgi:hypothetical protein